VQITKQGASEGALLGTLCCGRVRQGGGWKTAVGQEDKSVPGVGVPLWESSHATCGEDACVSPRGKNHRTCANPRGQTHGVWSRVPEDPFWAAGLLPATKPAAHRGALSPALSHRPCFVAQKEGVGYNNYSNFHGI
jgi:hypothetical protein